MFSILAKWLRHSSNIHARQVELLTLDQVVDLMDRFLDDRLSYALEWDDFISWENQNPLVEAVRRDIEKLEPLFFREGASSPESTRQLVTLRNRVAETIGIALRAMPIP